MCRESLFWFAPLQRNRTRSPSRKVRASASLMSAFEGKADMSVSLTLTSFSFFDPKISEYKEANCRRQVIGLACLVYLFNERRHRNLFVFSYFQQAIPKFVLQRDLNANRFILHVLLMKHWSVLLLSRRFGLTTVKRRCVWPIIVILSRSRRWQGAGSISSADVAYRLRCANVSRSHKRERITASPHR